MNSITEPSAAGVRLHNVQPDPDLDAMGDRLERAAFHRKSPLDGATRRLVQLVVLAALQSDEVKTLAETALDEGLSPVSMREALYQCAPYIGIPRTKSALRPVNEVFAARGLSLPLESRATVTEDDRFAKGLAVQKGIFGNAIDAMHAAAPEGQKAIMVEHLSAFCFGDVYTRSGLDLKTRELLTFCIISALGGCESQVKSHVQGNANVGNEKQKLIDALETCLPLMGFPRTLNALSCVNAVMAD
ncbi:carboxymuconolactone decarboxylase family protein [uncultured Mailhella sp.]|uniref:carboxymuconolactone decarboxylase family protein n=1 Tax=uncultured Mailhella sp. TaxID=1981031 RepID=UPI0025F59CFB|nr:carboxymuconolactone decarboxylase family protein [uncultured Mailhella sp.]